MSKKILIAIGCCIAAIGIAAVTPASSPQLYRRTFGRDIHQRAGFRDIREYRLAESDEVTIRSSVLGHPWQ